MSVPTATTLLDKHNTIFTKEALEGAAEQIRTRARKTIVGVEHDRTVPPLGVVTGATVRPIGEGHFGLFTDRHLFPEPTPHNVTVDPDVLIQRSGGERVQLSTAVFSDTDWLGIGVDWTNFESADSVDDYLAGLSSLHDVTPYSFGRRSILNDPEIVLTLGAKAAGIWLLVRAAEGIAKSAGEVAGEGFKVICSTLASAIHSYAQYAIPKNRPTTYVLQVPGEPNLEFVARTTDVHMAVRALNDGNFESVLDDVQSLISECEDVEFVQFIMTSDGHWKFNYLITHHGETLGTRECFGRRAVLLHNILNIGSSANTSFNVGVPPGGGVAGAE